MYIGSMPQENPLQIELLPGSRELLGLHARELPQRDDLCGAFCGALALGSAGITAHGGGPVDQDAGALAAGGVVAGGRARGGHTATRRTGPARLPHRAAADRRL